MIDYDLHLEPFSISGCREFRSQIQFVLKTWDSQVKLNGNPDSGPSCATFLKKNKSSWGGLMPSVRRERFDIV